MTMAEGLSCHVALPPPRPREPAGPGRVGGTQCTPQHHPLHPPAPQRAPWGCTPQPEPQPCEQGGSGGSHMCNACAVCAERVHCIPCGCFLHVQCVCREPKALPRVCGISRAVWVPCVGSVCMCCACSMCCACPTFSVPTRAACPCAAPGDGDTVPAVSRMQWLCAQSPCRRSAGVWDPVPACAAPAGVQGMLGVQGGTGVPGFGGTGVCRVPARAGSAVSLPLLPPGASPACTRHAGATAPGAGVVAQGRCQCRAGAQTVRALMRCQPLQSRPRTAPGWAQYQSQAVPVPAQRGSPAVPVSVPVPGSASHSRVSASSLRVPGSPGPGAVPVPGRRQ